MKKTTVREFVESMPDEIDLVALFSRLYVIEQIEKGEESPSVEGAIPHADVARRFELDDDRRKDRNP